MFITNRLNDWILDRQIDTIIGNLTSVFESFNESVADVAENAGFMPGSPPAGSPFTGVPQIIETVSTSVLLPVAALILSGVLTWEFFTVIQDKQSWQDIDSGMFFRWLMKAFIAIIVVSNAHTIVYSMFEVGSWMTTELARVISRTGAGVVPANGFDFVDRNYLKPLGWWQLSSISISSLILKITAPAMKIMVMVIGVGRIIEIYLMVALAPIPLATMTNRNWGVGVSYLKSIAALVLQGFMMVMCMAIYKGMLDNWFSSFTSVPADNLDSNLWKIIGYSVVLIFAMSRLGGLAKSVVGAH